MTQRRKVRLIPGVGPEKPPPKPKASFTKPRGYHCKHCGVLFYRMRKDHVFCDPTCRAKHHRGITKAEKEGLLSRQRHRDKAKMHKAVQYLKWLSDDPWAFSVDREQSEAYYLRTVFDHIGCDGSCLPLTNSKISPMDLERARTDDRWMEHFEKLDEQWEAQKHEYREKDRRARRAAHLRNLREPDAIYKGLEKAEEDVRQDLREGLGTTAKKYVANKRPEIKTQRPRFLVSERDMLPKKN